MKRVLVLPAMATVFVLVTLVCSDPAAAAEAKKKKAPKDRVVAMYFHRTQRCPTCLKMGDYSEEAIASGFEKQVKLGTVEFHYIDFQDKKNKAFTKAYKITGPALILARVADGKVAEFKNLEGIWSHAGEKKAFVKYVRDHVADYLAKQKRMSGDSAVRRDN